MTFTEIHGNLFDRKLEENEFYVHCISRDYACGAGIAKEFNKRYNLTENLRKDRNPTLCMRVDNVLNLVTKSKYWQKPTYKSLRYSLEYLKSILDYPIKFPHGTMCAKTLVMPRIGCGLDKLQWKNVKKIIKEIFEDTDIAIEVYYL